MGRSTTYKTKQKEELSAYLQAMAGKHITVNEIQAYFKEKEIPIGLTTIYRHLDALVEEGLVNRIKVEGISGACYEYVGEDSHLSSFHLKCEKCGKIINFQCKELEKIEHHLEEDHGFTIDSTKTIFYGVCVSCSQKR